MVRMWQPLLLLLLPSLCLLLASAPSPCDATLVRYYIAAEPMDWDYAPSGTDRIAGELSEEAVDLLQHTPGRIGSVYKKSRYVGYTDATFIKKVPKSPSMGLLGPVIRASVGDVIHITFKNNLPFVASMHAHGVLYQKQGEGAPYQDGDTAASTMMGALVEPGAWHVYEWFVPERAGPGPEDPSSVVWPYHSHSNEAADINSGLVGPIVITRTGAGSVHELPSDVHAEQFLLFNVFDENASPWLDANVAAYAPSADPDDEAFQHTNKMHAINGYVYGNLQGLELEQGKTVRWYMMAFGEETGHHSPIFHGNAVTLKRSGGAFLSPAMSWVADMTPDILGTWLIRCGVIHHWTHGMAALYTVKPSTTGVRRGQEDTPSSRNPTKVLYIQAEEVLWTYAPTGKDGATGVDLADVHIGQLQCVPGPHLLGCTRKKAVYRRYTGPDFQQQMAPPSELEHLQLMGPLIRAVVGDTIHIVFRNALSFPASLHASGPFSTKNYEGDKYAGSGQMVAPLNQTTYEWTVSASCGPVDGLSSRAWMYTSRHDPAASINAGLVGPIVVTAAHSADTTGHPKDVDRELFLLFSVINEHESPYLRWNLNQYAQDPEGTDIHSHQFIHSNQFHTINGLGFGNLQIRVIADSKVRWHLLSVGDEVDVHTVNWQGDSVLVEGARKTAVMEAPGLVRTVDMVPATVGRWRIQCLVDHHVHMGMHAVYVVEGAVPTVSPLCEHGPHYYLRAEQIEWDYAPSGTNLISGLSFASYANQSDVDPNTGDHSHSHVHRMESIHRSFPNVPQKMLPMLSDVNVISVIKGGGRLGRVYQKAVFVGYTDGTWTSKLPRGRAWAHLGLMGPPLRAEVGQCLRVTLSNGLSGPYAGPVSFKGYGLGPSMDNNNKGSDTKAAAEAWVYPGKEHTYSWIVPEAAGPGPRDPSSVVWPYRSGCQLETNSSAGLVGPLIVSRAGTAYRPNGAPIDVDREFVVLYEIFDENQSPLLPLNVQMYSEQPELSASSNPYYAETNLMHSINGYLFGAMPGLSMLQGEAVRWYVMGMGSERDVHTAHWHGSTVLWAGSRLDVVDVFPGVTRTVDMSADAEGLWLMHCHVDDHLTNGMVAVYEIRANPALGYPVWATEGSNKLVAPLIALTSGVVITILAIIIIVYWSRRGTFEAH